MRIAVYQGPKTASHVAGHLSVMERAAMEASAAGARLLILPEMFLTGYHIGAEAVARLAEPADGASAQAAAAIAGTSGLALLYGYPERGDDGRVYNAARLVDRTRETLAHHRKTHLFGDIDRQAFSPGDGPPAIADLDGVGVGILICYDIEFPENARLLALAGADLIAVPTALMTPYDYIARTLVTARAYENQVFLAYANRIGRERELDYLGQSCIVGPDGADLARADDEEALIVADLDPARLTRSRAINTYLQDRRPDLYGSLAAHLPIPPGHARPDDRAAAPAGDRP